jgi:hypothetical protein
MRLYVGVIWPDDAKPGIRVSIEADDLDDAVAKLEAEHGRGHRYTLHNPEEADKKR